MEELQQQFGILGIFAIFDLKSKRYDTPFFGVSDLMAKRRYMIIMEDEQSPLRKWKEDFELHRVGIFDVTNGNMLETGDPLLILKGEEVK
mgnify:CR=1 FL=1